MPYPGPRHVAALLFILEAVAALFMACRHARDAVPAAISAAEFEISNCCSDDNPEEGGDNSAEEEDEDDGPVIALLMVVPIAENVPFTPIPVAVKAANAIIITNADRMPYVTPVTAFRFAHITVDIIKICFFIFIMNIILFACV